VQPQNNFQEMLRDAAKQEQARVAAAISDTQIKVVTATFDKSVAYTNLMLVGGYAGFFGLWQLTKDYISKPQALWAALLVLISLVSFIIFEVIKMIFITRSIQKQARILNSPTTRSDPQLLIKQLNELQAIQERGSMRFMVCWAIAVAVALSTALAGAGILCFAFISGLLK
jgi:hypothetical protein